MTTEPTASLATAGATSKGGSHHGAHQGPKRMKGSEDMAKATKKPPRAAKRRSRAKRKPPKSQRPGAPPRPPNLKGEAVIDGVKPKPGMWLIHPGRKRCYGTVRRVRHTGEVVTLGHYECSHGGAMLSEGGYRYVSERPPIDDGWASLVHCAWISEPPGEWGIPQNGQETDQEPDADPEEKNDNGC